MKTFWGLARWEWALITLALALRLGYSAHVYFSGMSPSSSDHYETIALNLIDHGGYDGTAGQRIPTAAREPAWTLYFTLFYFLFGPCPYVVLASLAFLNIGTCLLLRASARRLFDDRAGQIALMISLFYPYFIYYAGFVFRETLLTFLVALLFLLVGGALRKPMVKNAAAVGLVAGLCAVTLSTYLAIMGLVALWFCLKLRAQPKSGRMIAAFLCALILLPALWIGRNFAVFGRFIPGSTLGGYNLYTSLIVPEEWRGTEREYSYEMADPHWARIMGMSELMKDDGSQQAAFFAVAVEYIKSHPGFYVKHIFKQAVKLWRPFPYERRYIHNYSLIKLLSLLSDGWLIPLGLMGLWVLRARRPEFEFAALFIAGGTLVYSMLSAIVRYRLPFMALLIIASSGMLARFLSRKN